MLWNIPAHSALLYMAFVQLFMLAAKVIVRLNPQFQKKWHFGFLLYLGLIVLGIVLCFPLSQFISSSIQGEQNQMLLTMRLAVWFMGAFLILDFGLDYITKDRSKQSKVEYLYPPKSTSKMIEK